MLSLHSLLKLSTIFLILFCTWAFPVQAEEVSLQRQAKQRWLEGDHEGVISLIEPWTKRKSGPYGNERDSLRILLAAAYQERKDWLLAAEQYSIVRRGSRNLAKYAQFQEPKAYFEGKQYWSAKKRCTSVLKKYPNDDASSDCLIILGMSSGELGQTSSSRTYFNQYMEKYPSSPYQEVFRLKQAEYTYRKSKTQGEALLYQLYFNHSYPTTDLEIQAIIGKEFPLNTLTERTTRIYSFIRGNRLKEAWALFQEIRLKEEMTTQEETWVTNSIVNISWRTRQFPSYIEEIRKKYDKKPSSELAWKIFRAYCKGGLWTEAASWGTQSINKFGKIGRWSGSTNQLARAHMFANQYEEAAELWGTRWGEESKFYQAFCLYMAGQYDLATPKLSYLVSKGKDWDAAAAYWLGRTQEYQELDPSASFLLAKEKDSSGWYDLLVETREQAAEVVVNARIGTWYDTHRQKLTPSPLLEIKTQIALAPYSSTKEASLINWERFQTPETTETAETLSSPPLPPSTPYKGLFPSGYTNTLFGTQADLEKFFHSFVLKYKNDYPYLRETELLISIGLYPDAARNMSRFAEEIQSYRQDFPFETRRALYLYSRNHHQTLRHTTNLEKHLDNEERILELKQMNYPIVRPSEIWDYTEQYNVDPYLMLGLMRQESAYREGVRSWVGAIGYIQVMPATGAKIAYLLDEKDYTPKRLENPRENLKYGIFYFSKLMERFDNCFPLAVGSYNGGPHNMSRWYRNRIGTWNLEEFIEHIPYDETRKYIKKVTGYYADYSRYYVEQPVRLPLAALKDDPEVIDF